MSEARWVQHKLLENGIKYPVQYESSIGYVIVRGALQIADTLCLPKSEYILCEPPEAWRDVTESCEFSYLSPTGLYLSDRVADRIILDGTDKGYRLQKLQSHDIRIGGWAFIVEQKP